MTACDRARSLIERLVEGTINDVQIVELKAHTEACAICREEFRRCHLVEEVVKDAFMSPTAAEQAGRRVLARLAAKPRPQVRAVQGPWIRAVAACLILGVGLLLGFAAGKARSGQPPRTPTLVRVPIRIGDLHGMVLVRHDNREVWQSLVTGAEIYLGDTFHSTAGSGFVLELEGNESTIEVNQNSMLALTSYDGETQFFLEHGECTASLEGPHGPFFIRTPHGRVEALGTQFTVTVE